MRIPDSSGEDMLKESYISLWNTLPPDAVKIRGARPSVLSASTELITDYKTGKITWQEFERRFRIEITTNPKAMAELKRLKALSKQKDVYLICYEKNPPCHRFILLDLIRELP